MDLNKVITILETLASGCSPATGKLIQGDGVLNERDVIRALQIAIDQLKKDIPRNHSDVEINKEDINAAIQLFQEHELAPTYSRLAGFFLGSRSFKNDAIHSNELYGKYKNLYYKGQLLDFFTTYLFDNGYSKHGKKTSGSHESKPRKEISFFQKETFNKLSQSTINQLKEKINELGILKTDNLSEYIQSERVNHPRAFEAWTDKEKELLNEALQYTNDLELLSECFQRGKGAIVSCSEKLIYQNMELDDGRNQN